MSWLLACSWTKCSGDSRSRWAGACIAGFLNDNLVARVGPERYAAALSRPHVRPMDFIGRPLSGFVYVDPRGVKIDGTLTKWLREATEYALSLPQTSRRL